MKNLLFPIGLVIVVIIAGLYATNSQEYGYVKGDTEVIEKEVEVEVKELDRRIAKAQEEAKAEIESKAQTAYDEVYAQGMDEVKLKTIKEYRAEIEEMETNLSKKVGEYWREWGNIKREIYSKAQEYGVSGWVMEQVVKCESQGSTTIQSNHVYTAKNVPKGYSVGDREQSYGLVQIHLPAHPSVSKQQAKDPEFALDFLAKNLAGGNANWWTCYRQLAMI